MDPIKIDHEANPDEVTEERREEIDKMPSEKRCFMLAKSKDPKYKDYRGASDGTIYHKVGDGPLRRVKKKETREERKARKKAVKARSNKN